MSNTASSPTPDASASVKGKLQLAGSLGGTAASPTVVTNANLTGPITSSGNATSIASQTGTGTKFVVDTSPTIVTPTIASFTNAQHDHSNAAGGGVLTHTGLPVGSVVQVVNTTTTAVATGTTRIPLDDTIPQNTEGDQYMTLAITPKSTTNTLVIDAIVMASDSAAGNWISAALFQDTTANALAAMPVYQNTTTGGVCIMVRHTMAAGTTSSTTFKIRAGGNAAGTTTFNGQSATRVFGAITKSSIVIWEIKA